MPIPRYSRLLQPPLLRFSSSCIRRRDFEFYAAVGAVDPTSWFCNVGLIALRYPSQPFGSHTSYVSYRWLCLWFVIGCSCILAPFCHTHSSISLIVHAVADTTYRIRHSGRLPPCNDTCSVCHYRFLLVTRFCLLVRDAFFSVTRCGMKHCGYGPAFTARCITATLPHVATRLSVLPTLYCNPTPPNALPCLRAHLRTGTLRFLTYSTPHTLRLAPHPRYLCGLRILYGHLRAVRKQPTLVGGAAWLV